MAGISKEVKKEILEKVKSGTKIMDVSPQYGASSKTIYYWLRGKADSNGRVIEVRKLRRENQELKEIVGALTIDLTKLKKKGYLVTRFLCCH